MSNNEQRQRPRKATANIEFSHPSAQREGESRVERPDTAPPVVTFRPAKPQRAA